MTIMSSERCLWCEREFQRRTSGGTPQRFCSKGCRYDFHRAARKWAMKAIDAGLLTVASLKNASTAACTLVTEANVGSLVSEHPETNSALCEPLTESVIRLFPRQPGQSGA